MKVHLLSSNHDGAQENKWEVPFDPSLREVTVSLSGPAPQIELSDPFGRDTTIKLSDVSFIVCATKTCRHIFTCLQVIVLVIPSSGRVVGVEQGLAELLNIPNSARVVNLKFPRPGAWKLKVLLWRTYVLMCKPPTT